MLSDWPLGGRGGIWLPVPDRERSKTIIMAKSGIFSQKVNRAGKGSWKGQAPPSITYTESSKPGTPISLLQMQKGNFADRNQRCSLCQQKARDPYYCCGPVPFPSPQTPAVEGYLALQQARVVLSETEQHWQESQQGMGRGLGCQAGEGRYEERKETELDYSALLGCWKSLMCSLQGSELLLSPWGDRLLNQTDPETYAQGHGLEILGRLFFRQSYLHDYHFPLTNKSKHTAYIMQS